MVDTKTPGDKTLSVSKTLTLKPRVETGIVRQSFSHGRTKQVVVEKRGKRRVGGEASASEPHAPEPVVVAPKPAAAPAKPPLSRPAPAAQRSGSGVVLRTLTEDERSARASALADAKVREVEERRLAEEEARRRSSKEGIEQAEREAAEARRKAEEDRHRLEEEAKRKSEVEAKKRFGEAEAKTAAAAARPGAPRPAGARLATTAATPPARAPGVAADAALATLFHHDLLGPAMAEALAYGARLDARLERQGLADTQSLVARRFGINHSAVPILLRDAYPHRL